MESLNRPPLKLVFGTPEFLPEGVVQSTVRVGQKWRDDLKGKVAPRIPCVDLEGNALGTATVVGSLFGSFKDFGYIGSTVNHQEDCREDVYGLIDVLTECYPTFNPDKDQVSVIFFKYAPVAGVSTEVVDEEEEAGPDGTDESSDDTEVKSDSTDTSSAESTETKTETKDDDSSEVKTDEAAASEA